MFLKKLDLENDNKNEGNKQEKIMSDLEKEFNQGIQYKSNYYSKRGLS